MGLRPYFKVVSVDSKQIISAKWFQIQLLKNGYTKSKVEELEDGNIKASYAKLNSKGNSEVLFQKFSSSRSYH